jgi:ABC-type antimicrobial peptide transport system permease subunit
MVVRAGLKLCGLGLALGLAAAFIMRAAIASLAFQVSTADPLVYAAAAAVMITTAMLACYLPARRASRVDPASAIRWE